LTYGASPPPGSALPTPPIPAAGLTGGPRLPSPPAPVIAPVIAPVTPPPAPPQLTARPLPATVLRSKPTAEGVVLQRTMVPTGSARPGSDALRATSPRIRPTTPAPLAVAMPLQPPEDDRSLDPVVLAYLAREVRPREA
jgi:hypothetical protein